MSVRWYSGNFTPGYGVTGDQQINDTPIKVIDVKDITREIPKPITDNGELDGDQILLHLLSVRWRFTLQVIEAEDEQISSYFPLFGNRKLGRWVAEAFQYVSQDGFWSYDKYISPRFTFTQRYIDFEVDPDDLPSSEPQADAPELFDLGALFFPWTDGFSIYSANRDIIADRVSLAVDPYVLLYRWGVTYDYTIAGYTAANISDVGGNINAYIL